MSHGPLAYRTYDRHPPARDVGAPHSRLSLPSHSPGGPQAVIHNASITRDGLLVKMSLHDWQAVQDVNLRGAFLVSKHAVRKMLRHRAGRVVYISSVSAVMGNAGQANYAASKSGLDGLARSVAQEYAGRGISACVLAAGLIDVGMGARLTPQIQAAKLAK